LNKIPYQAGCIEEAFQIFSKHKEIKLDDISQAFLKIVYHKYTGLPQDLTEPTFPFPYFKVETSIDQYDDSSIHYE